MPGLFSARRSTRSTIERLIVFTDEQSHDRVEAPKGVGYLVKVAAYQHGVGFGDWRRVDGLSEAVVTWIAATEAG
jgi:60 kDa SS-A/Ro ribonucleoprotein